MTGRQFLYAVVLVGLGTLAAEAVFAVAYAAFKERQARR